MQGITWILVADATRARLFEHRHRPAPPLALVFEDSRPELRDRDWLRNTDQHGRVQESAVAGGHAMEPHTSLDERLRQQYARDLLDRLHAEAQTRPFHNLVLVAPPPMLGVLRKLFDHEFGDRVIGSLDKDLTHLSEHDLREHLREWLKPY